MHRFRQYLMLLWSIVLALGGGSFLAAPALADTNRPVLAMYYAWYDSKTWTSGKTSDLPQTPYISADRATIERQVAQAQSAGVDGFELDWWGPGNPTDTNLQTLLSVADAHGFTVTADFDMNSPFIHNPGDITNDLLYMKRYFNDPAWFRIDGKPVVVFYGTRDYDVGTWGTIRHQADPNNDAVWIAEGDIFSYLTVFDGIHPYSVAWSSNPSGQLASYASRTRAYPGKRWVATVQPGYSDVRIRGSQGFTVSRQNGDYYRSMWQGAIATQPAYISITSWNEWMEGTQIEPSQSYGDLYLQITKQMSDQFKGTSSGAAPSTSGSSSMASGGAFFTQAGQGKGGYWISNDGAVRFYDAFQSMGGAGALGYPASQRFQLSDGFTYQATQGVVFQWHPELGRAELANTFEWFTNAGKDDYLLSVDGIPKPIRDDGSNGDWQKAKQIRLSWLTDDAIRQAYLSAGSVDQAIALYGLPMSRPERHGPFVTQRFQRIAFQHWVENVSGMPPAGSVVRVLAGDILKQTGIIPAAAQVPQAQ